MEDNKKYVSVPFNMIFKHETGFPVDLYIRLSNSSKIIKLGHRNEDIKDRLTKYQEKGVHEVFVLEDEYDQILKTVKEELIEKGQISRPPKKGDVETLSDGHEMVKESLIKIGFTETAVKLALEVNKKSIEMLQAVPNIFQFLKSFQQNSSEEYMRGLLNSYTATTMLTKFTWQTQEIKEKLAMAALLCDVTLSQNDLKTLREQDPDKFSEDLKGHPIAIAELLSQQKDAVSSETLTVIRQHHEKPDGTGFPSGLGHQNIAPLSCIYIVADRFIGLMLKHNFDFQKKDEIVQKLKDDYHQGNFKKSRDALFKTLGFN